MAFQTAFGYNPLFRGGQVALTTGDQGAFVIRRMVVAIETVKAEPLLPGVGFVVKENFASVGVIHQADGLLRCCNRKSGIADNGDQKQLDRYAVDDHAVLL